MKINIKIKINSKLATVFYVLAFLVLIVFGLSVYSTTVYVYSLVSSGSLTVSGNVIDIIIYYCSSCLGYFIDAVILYVSGYVISFLKRNFKETEEKVEEE